MKGFRILSISGNKFMSLKFLIYFINIKRYVILNALFNLETKSFHLAKKIHFGDTFMGFPNYGVV